MLVIAGNDGSTEVKETIVTTFTSAGVMLTLAEARLSSGNGEGGRTPLECREACGFGNPPNDCLV
jgi:hypothetical protein